ncbi:MAG: YkgJ family cysteine cluster protein [Pyrinomonadaceae bacterium]
MSESDWVSGNIGIRVNGIPLEFDLTVPAAPVKPQRMLPIFQQMANSMVAAGVEVIEGEGKKISCKAHCGACCRQAVPISDVEVYHIADIVSRMPEPRQSEVRARFDAAARHFKSIGWYDRFSEHQAKAPDMEPDAARREGVKLVLEYFHEGVPCPFLEDESCSIHPDRPVVCREYLVTTPSENCADPTPESIDGVELLIKPSKALKRLNRNKGIESHGMPILTRALELAEMYPENFESKPGPEWVKDLFSTLAGNEQGENIDAAASRS